MGDYNANVKRMVEARRASGGDNVAAQKMIHAKQAAAKALVEKNQQSNRDKDNGTSRAASRHSESECLQPVNTGGLEEFTLQDGKQAPGMDGEAQQIADVLKTVVPNREDEKLANADGYNKDTKLVKKTPKPTAKAKAMDNNTAARMFVEKQRAKARGKSIHETADRMTANGPSTTVHDPDDPYSTLPLNETAQKILDAAEDHTPVDGVGNDDNSPTTKFLKNIAGTPMESPDVSSSRPKPGIGGRGSLGPRK